MGPEMKPQAMLKHRPSSTGSSAPSITLSRCEAMPPTQPNPYKFQVKTTCDYRAVVHRVRLPGEIT